MDFVKFQDVLLPGERLPLTIIARPIHEPTADQVIPIRRSATGPAPQGAIPVWASEAALDLRGFDVGTEFDLPLGGKVVRATVRGMWRDYERPGGSIVMDRETFIALSGERTATTAALWLREGTDVAEFSGRLRDAIARSGDYDVAIPGEIRKRSLALFDRTFAVTYLLEAVAVLIGLFGISASMSSQVLARRGEFGMLRHLGVTRREIGRMLAFEGAALGAIGVAAGLVVGAIVSMILIFVVNRQSFHWTMDVHVPWGLLAILSLVLIAGRCGDGGLQRTSRDGRRRRSRREGGLVSSRPRAPSPAQRERVGVSFRSLLLLLVLPARLSSPCAQAQKSRIHRSCRATNSHSRATKAVTPTSASNGGT